MGQTQPLDYLPQFTLEPLGDSREFCAVLRIRRTQGNQLCIVLNPQIHLRMVEGKRHYLSKALLFVTQ